MENEKVYQKTWFVVLLLIFFWPVGLILMWSQKKFNTAARVVISVLCGLALVVVLSGDNQPKAPTTSQPTQQTAPKAELKPTATTTDNQSQPATSAPEPKQEDPKSKPAPAPPPAPTWNEVITFKGSSIKNTQSFHISSEEWRIEWSTKPGQYGDMNFILYTYNADGSMKEPGVVANIIGAGSDISYMRGSGDYYLTINTAQPYTVIIKEKK